MKYWLSLLNGSSGPNTPPRSSVCCTVVDAPAASGPTTAAARTVSEVVMFGSSET